MAHLDDLAQASEYLERGNRNKSFVRIGISQISHFYARIANTKESTSEGRLLLAQHGIDVLKSEALLKRLEASATADGKSNQETAASTVIPPSQRPLTAIEQMKRLDEERISAEWEELQKETIEMLNNFDPTKVVVEENEPYFTRDVRTLSDIANRAIVYASHMSSFAPQDIIENSIKACKQLEAMGMQTSPIQVDIFQALKDILVHEEFSQDENLEPLLNNPHFIRVAVNGSINFLQKQYRAHNPTSNFDIATVNSSNMWYHIWKCIRSGNYQKVQDIARLFPRQTERFLASFEKCVILKNPEDPEVRNRLLNFTPQSVDDFFYQKCAISFTLGTDIPLEQQIIETAEDYLFCLLSPLRLLVTQSGISDDTQGLTEIQAIIRDEGGRQFREGEAKFIHAIIMLGSLAFSNAAEELVSAKVYTVESIHVCIALYKWGLWNHPSFRKIIEEYVSLLPPELDYVAYDYLEAVGAI